MENTKSFTDTILSYFNQYKEFDRLKDLINKTIRNSLLLIELSIISFFISIIMINYINHLNYDLQRSYFIIFITGLVVSIVSILYNIYIIKDCKKVIKDIENTKEEILNTILSLVNKYEEAIEKFIDKHKSSQKSN